MFVIVSAIVAATSTCAPASPAAAPSPSETAPIHTTRRQHRSLTRNHARIHPRPPKLKAGETGSPSVPLPAPPATNRRSASASPRFAIIRSIHPTAPKNRSIAPAPAESANTWGFATSSCPKTQTS